MLENATKEYEKNTKLKKSDVNNIVEWLEKQPHLPTLNEFQICNFLHSCQYSLESTKKTIDAFCLSKNWPVIRNRNEETINFLEVFLFCVLPEQTTEGYDVLFIKIMDKNVDKFDFSKMIAFFSSVITLHIAQNGSSRGMIWIVDTEGCGFSHFMKLNAVLLKKYIFYTQEALPIILKGVFIFNFSTLAEKGFKMIKPLINDKFLNMIEIHPKLETLLASVNLDILPSDYGGKMPSVNQLIKNTRLNLLENLKYLQMEELVKSDESKRLNWPDHYDEIFMENLQGSFRKLEID